MTCIKNTTRGCCFSTSESGELTAKNCPGCHKLDVFDWMADLPDPLAASQIYEIQFKNTRKGYYLNNTELSLKIGDIVAVEASPGHDIGIITLTGELVTKQMRRTGFNTQGLEFKKIYRKAKPYDIEKWQESIAMEHSTMIQSRQIVADMKLNMKIGDVEYQGDRLKAIFYYIADERVDFRELIKVLAEMFRIRVEMRQIGARQEAGRIGGIAICGRELCCSTWINNFSSVTIGAARHQEMSLNPQKLAGQCGKLKCCLNYELDSYIDARRSFPRLTGPLEAMDGNYHLVKSDIFSKVMWFSPDPRSTLVMVPLGTDRVKKIVAMNRRGEKIDRIEDITLIKATIEEEPQIKNVVGEESITRFDNARSNKRHKNDKRNNNNKQGHNKHTSRQSSDKGGNSNNSGNNGARPEQAQKQQSQRGQQRTENRPTASPELTPTGEGGGGRDNRGGANRRNNNNRSGNKPRQHGGRSGNSGSVNPKSGGSRGDSSGGSKGGDGEKQG